MGHLRDIIAQLAKIVAEYPALLAQVKEEDYQFKPGLKKWSKREILGHLVDSAQNNIRRFIVAQYETKPFIIYQQDDWVAISNYQQYDTKDLIALWTLLNKHICKILMNTTEAAAGSLCATNDPEPHSIEWLARDYNRHLLHHLHQVLEMEPVVYP